MTSSDHYLKPYATARQWEYFQLQQAGLSNTKVADVLGIDRRAVDRGIERIFEKARKAGVILAEPEQGIPNVLYIDIETAPQRAWIWRMWDQVTNIDMVETEWYVMSYAYKWMGGSEIFTKTLDMTEGYTVGTEDDSELIRDCWHLMDAADIIIAHNGDNFDIKKLKTRMVSQGLKPPSPFKTIDTLKICKREFKFTSNKLEYVARVLLGRGKLSTGGISLWFDCIAGAKDAWKKMLEYNAMDVDVLEQVYLKLRPWDKGHPNLALVSPLHTRTCTVCTGTDVVEQAGKSVFTGVSRFPLYTCQDCGHHMRGRRSILTEVQRDNVLPNAR